MLRFIAFALLTLMLQAVQAGDKYPPLQPSVTPPTSPEIPPTPRDDWSNWHLHAGVSAGIGALTYAAIPNAHWALHGAICLLPGVVDEIRDKRRPGGRFSGRDVIADIGGCAIGLAGAHQIKIRFAPNWVGIGLVF